MAKLLYGVGINDEESVSSPSINGVQIKCKIYTAWYDMLRRCYSTSYHKKYPKYIGCSVCPEWFKFSSFKAWALAEKKTEKCQLDKDLLIKGNKVYSPDTCCWIGQDLNKFLTVDQVGKTNNLPTGVSYKGKRLQATCNNPFTKKLEHLGYYDSVEEAHLAWKIRKHEHALTYINTVVDPRIKDAILRWFPDPRSNS